MNTSLFPVLPRKRSGQNRKKRGLGFGGRFPRAALVPRLPWAVIVLPFQGGRWSLHKEEGGMIQSKNEGPMELFIFARFHAREGEEGAVAAAMREMLGLVRAEAGCLAIEAFRSTRDPRLFYVHSRWIDEAAFDMHAGLPHTVRFLERVQTLIDHQID